MTWEQVLHYLFEVGMVLFYGLFVLNTFRHYDFLKQTSITFAKWVGILEKDAVFRPVNLSELLMKMLVFGTLVFLFAFSSYQYEFLKMFYTLKFFDFFQKKSKDKGVVYCKEFKHGKRLVEHPWFIKLYPPLLFVAIATLLFAFSWSDIAFMVMLAWTNYDFLKKFIKEYVAMRKEEEKLTVLEGIKQVFSTTALFYVVSVSSCGEFVSWGIRSLENYVFAKKVDFKKVLVTQVKEAVEEVYYLLKYSRKTLQ